MPVPRNQWPEGTANSVHFHGILLSNKKPVERLYEKDEEEACCIENARVQ